MTPENIKALLEKEITYCEIVVEVKDENKRTLCLRPNSPRKFAEVIEMLLSKDYGRKSN